MRPPITNARPTRLKELPARCGRANELRVDGDCAEPGRGAGPRRRCVEGGDVSLSLLCCSNESSPYGADEHCLLDVLLSQAACTVLPRRECLLRRRPCNVRGMSLSGEKRVALAWGQQRCGWRPRNRSKGYGAPRLPAASAPQWRRPPRTAPPVPTGRRQSHPSSRPPAHTRSLREPSSFGLRSTLPPSEPIDSTPRHLAAIPYAARQTQPWQRSAQAEVTQLSASRPAPPRTPGRH